MCVYQEIEVTFLLHYFVRGQNKMAKRELLIVSGLSFILTFFSLSLFLGKIKNGENSGSRHRRDAEEPVKFNDFETELEVEF